jgi:hypothetical protein
MYPPDGRGESLFTRAAALELRRAGAERVAVRDEADAAAFDFAFDFAFEVGVAFDVAFGFAFARELEATWVFAGFD